MCIGETGRRLSDWFGEHLRSVEGFSQTVTTHDTKGVVSLWRNILTSLTMAESTTCECPFSNKQREEPRGDSARKDASSTGWEPGWEKVERRAEKGWAMKRARPSKKV